jgi:hypothetical protein
VHCGLAPFLLFPVLCRPPAFVPDLASCRLRGIKGCSRAAVGLRFPHIALVAPVPQASPVPFLLTCRTPAASYQAPLSVRHSLSSPNTHRSTMFRLFTLFLGLCAVAWLAQAKHHRVTVGGPGVLAYDPEFVVRLVILGSRAALLTLWPRLPTLAIPYTLSSSRRITLSHNLPLRTHALLYQEALTLACEFNPPNLAMYLSDMSLATL